MMTGDVTEVRLHSRLSPSNFVMSEACTMSVRYRAHLPPGAPGPAALLGTAAHMLFERCLREGVDMFELADVDRLEVDGEWVEVDAGMRELVQVAVDAARAILVGRDVQIEQRVEFGFVEMVLGEKMWGHADVLAPDPPIIVIDLKAGYNAVPADAPQLGLYLMAAALQHDAALAGEGHAGSTVIIQPAAPGETVKRHEWTWADLRNLRDRVITLLRRIKRQDWTYADGDHCRWCPAIGMCPHIAAVARDHAMAMVAPTPEMVANGEVTAQTLADWMDVADRLDAWAKRVHEVALDYAIHGGVIPGRKLVRKRAVRRWVEADEARAAAQLAELGIDPWQKKIVTPAEAERRLPKARRNEVAALAEVPTGELTLAKGDDPRESVDVGASLRAALRASVAAGYIEQGQQRVLVKTNSST